MGRTKTFDEEEALERALDLFWTHGYEGTSMQALVDHMGINRSSLYNTFGDKRALYLAAIDRYIQSGIPGVIVLMQQDFPVRDIFQRLFKGTVETALGFSDNRGCFLVNAVIDQVPHNAPATNTIEQSNHDMVQAFHQALARAQEQGGLDAQHDPLRLAHYFMNALNGIRVTVKTTTDRATLDAIIETTLSVLD